MYPKTALCPTLMMCTPGMVQRRKFRERNSRNSRKICIRKRYPVPYSYMMCTAGVVQRRSLVHANRAASEPIQVQDREVFLGGLRGLLFPPESTSSPETAGGSHQLASSLAGANSHRYDALPPVSSPTKASLRMFQGPSIREVQAAVGNLREASLCVVEAIQAWRRARQGECKLAKQGDSPRSCTFGGDHETSLWDASRPRVEHGELAAGEVPEVREFPEVKFPVVPTARSVFAGDGDLPVFLWLPPAVRERESGGIIASASRSFNLDPETAVPERVGHDLNGDALASAAATPDPHRHSNSVVGSTAPTTACDANADSTSDGKASLAHHALSSQQVSGVNYLARMATDTDFIGAPGSILADFFPPDTKLYRNPFVLGHNLDDTLAVFTNGNAISPRNCGHQDGVEAAGSSPAALRKSRLDTRRVRHAAATIVAEDARERAGKGIKRHRDEGRRGDEWEVEGAGDGDGVPSGIATEGGQRNFNTKHDGQRSDRPDSGYSRGSDGDHGGSGESPKKSRGKGGITFEDQNVEGRCSQR